MKKVAYILCLLTLCVAVNPAQTKSKLTEAQIAAKFEEMVVANGYTDLPPTDDKSKLVPEPVDGGTDESELSRRKNMLERKPFRITKGNRFSADGWTAVFLYRQPCKNCSKNSARVAYLDAYGENFRFEHQDVILKKLPKINKPAAK